MQLTLSDPEMSLLREILDEDYRNLKEEINKTETADFKHELKEREALLESVLHKLGDLNTVPSR